ncbi:hypothetical protein DL764_009074 [Monosporascus ibericus]|uniref:Carboxylic ester hydrolase n=1 Tax=Monosporascus ibericus TaxID=155417 RepID=A0A4Q4SVV0_9PEZI|nr:hypothetical protein DL764_009074 [Monosporascus ibericus]
MGGRILITRLLSLAVLYVSVAFGLYDGNNTVDLGCNKYAGVSGSNSITKWLGVRYAAPPLGDLRFLPPEEPPCDDAVQIADQHGKWCLATGAAPDNPDTSEDCLFLDVYAPANVTASSKLPVFVFIQGGGFNSNSSPNLDGSGLITASGHSIVVVTFNYRVGPYGFITNGNFVKANNGLRDQRKALEWVQRHISKFGGDPDHVVLGGSSAGAASITLQLAAYGGRDENLFHAAAAESPAFATMLTVEESRYQYENFVIRVGCVGHDSLGCLRSKTAEELQEQNTNVPYPGAAKSPLYMWGPVLDFDLITDLTYNSFAWGRFIRVPMIFGDDTNGGTVFTPRNASAIGESNIFLHDQYPYLDLAHLMEVNSLYPNQNTSCPSPGCYWRQVSDVYGDMRFMCPAMFISSMAAQYGVPRSWNYRYNVEDPGQMAEGIGVPHTVELHAIFGPENTRGGPQSYQPGGINAHIVPVIQAYWTSFIRSFDPNKFRLPGTSEWQMWNSSSRQRIVFETGGNTTVEPVNENTWIRCEYLSDLGATIKQ